MKTAALPSSLSIIIPAYNEADFIGTVLDRIKALEGAADWEILVVDDGSSDETADVAKAHGARVIRHPYNLGNGASVKSGALAARGDWLLFLDGDGQHPPEEIPTLLAHANTYDMIVGARTAQSKVSRFRGVGNRVLIAVAQFLVQRKIDDLTSGFRAIRTERFLEFLHLLPQRYSYPTTITMAMFSAGYLVKYVPLSTIVRRQGGQSNIRPFKDGMRFINIMFRIIMLFNPHKVFLPIAAFFFALGFGVGLYDVIVHVKMEESTLLFLILSVFVFLFGLLADQIAHIRRELHQIMRAHEEKPSASPQTGTETKTPD